MSAAASAELDELMSVGGRIGERDAPPAAASPGVAGAPPPYAGLSWSNFLCHSDHPVASFFHLVFKALALFVYIFGSSVGLDYVLSFVACVLPSVCKKKTG